MPARNIQNVQSPEASDASKQMTFQSVQEGSCLIVCCAALSASFAFSAPTDDRSNTWTQATQAIGTGLRVAIYRAQNVAAGTTVVTGTLGGVASWIMFGMEFSGVVRSQFGLEVQTGSSSSFASSIAAGNLNPQTPSLAVAMGVTLPTAYPVLGSTQGFTELHVNQGVGAQRTAYRLMAANTNAQAQWSWTTGAQDGIGASVSVQEQGVPTGSRTRSRRTSW